MIADEQRLLHGGGGNLEVLEDEGHDKEADGEHGADGGERLEGGLVVFLVLWGWNGADFSSGVVAGVSVKIRSPLSA